MESGGTWIALFFKYMLRESTHPRMNEHLRIGRLLRIYVGWQRNFGLYEQYATIKYGGKKANIKRETARDFYALPSISTRAFYFSASLQEDGRRGGHRTWAHSGLYCTTLGRWAIMADYRWSINAPSLPFRNIASHTCWLSTPTCYKTAVGGTL